MKRVNETESDDSLSSKALSVKSIKHSWEHQKKFIDFLDHKQVENCLVYEPINWSQKDWDNIAPIVPKYILHLAHYMQGIVDFCGH